MDRGRARSHARRGATQGTIAALEPPNLVLRFLLELGTLAALAYWGWTAYDGAARWGLAVGAPAAAATVWWLFVAPKARIQLPPRARLPFEAIVFAAAVAALAAAGRPALAIVFAALVVVSSTLNYFAAVKRETP